MTENMPAAERQAAVSSPDTALATERPARINVVTNIKTAASGVLIDSTIEDPFPIKSPCFQNELFLFLVFDWRILSFGSEACSMIKPTKALNPVEDLHDRVTRHQRLPTAETEDMLAVFVAQRPEVRLF